jgi:hypothetical protein
MTKKKKITRRDFLKLSWTSLWGLFLVACKLKDEEIFTVTPSSTATNTATQTPSQTSTPTATETNAPTPSNTPTETPIPCFRLLTPENDAELEVIGKTIFSWETMPNATQYKLEITLPSGQTVSFETGTTERGQYMEAFRMGGTYTWKVVALDNSGKIICTSAPFTFQKSENTQKEQGDGGNGGNGDGGSGGPTTGPVVGQTIGN